MSSSSPDRLNPPEGWFVFGTHAWQKVEVEFSAELDRETLMPLWERPKPPVEPEPNEWEEMLRKIGLGAGLHEPLRTKVIESAVENLAEVLAEHDRKVAEQAWDDACDMFGDVECNTEDRYDILSNVRIENPHRRVE